MAKNKQKCAPSGRRQDRQESRGCKRQERRGQNSTADSISGREDGASGSVGDFEAGIANIG